MIPFLVWSLIYLGWYCGNHPGTCTPSLVRKLLFVQGTYYHLWFMYSLIGIYLILPVLRLLVKPEVDRKILWYLIVLCLVFQSVLNFAKYFGGFRIGISAPLASGLVGFFILGYLLGPLKLSRLTALFTGAAWILATLGTILGTYFLTQASGKFENYFYGFTTPNVIVASATGFLLLKWISETRDIGSSNSHRFMRQMAAASFGIYQILAGVGVGRAARQHESGRREVIEGEFTEDHPDHAGIDVALFQLRQRRLVELSAVRAGHRGIFDAFDVTALGWYKHIDPPRLWCYHEVKWGVSLSG